MASKFIPKKRSARKPTHAETMEELQRSKEYYRLLAEASPFGIFRVDKFGKFLFINDAGAAHIGKTPKELVGKHFNLAVTVKTLPATLRIFADVIQGKSSHGEHVVRHKDGYDVPIYYSFTPFKENGKVVGITGVTLNLTEQKKSEKELRESHEKLQIAYDKLKELDELKTRFLIITSHELKTPITPLLIQSQMLMDGALGDLTDKQKKSLDVIMRNIKHLNSLISDILDISRIQSRSLKFSVLKKSLEKTIEDVINVMMPLASEKNITISVNLPSLPLLYFDSDRINQVVTNLVSNAIKFTPDHGKIILSVAKEKEVLRVSVKDTGIGIASKDQIRVFDPFVQLETSMARTYSGTGLGLAICKGIVEYHGGTIGVESTLKKGSTFYFTIPLKKTQIQTKPLEQYLQKPTSNPVESFSSRVKKVLNMQA